MELDDTATDAAVLGIEPPPSKKPKDFEVLPDAWPAVAVFLRVQTQWRTSAGGVVGLDYGPVRWVFNLLQIKDPVTTLADLQIIEATVIAGMNKRSK
jgi:hypothetical protein